MKQIKKSKDSYLGVSKSCRRFIQVQELQKLFNGRSDLTRTQLGSSLGVSVGQDPVPAPEVRVGHALGESVLVEPDSVENLGSAELKGIAFL